MNTRVSKVRIEPWVELQERSIQNTKARMLEGFRTRVQWADFRFRKINNLIDNFQTSKGAKR